MEKYIAFLRGINVGGHRSIKMDDLKKLHIEMGHRNVVTFLQSGNVIFECTLKKREKLIREIEDKYKEKLNFDVDVIICNVPEIFKIARECPYTQAVNNDTKLIHVVQLSDIPQGYLVSELMQHEGPEEKQINGNILYVYYTEGAGRSKFNLSYIERTLKVRGIARNWNTITRLLDLVAE